MINKQRFEAIARDVKGELRRQGLEVTRELKTIRYLGLYTLLSKWDPDCPDIALYAHNYFSDHQATVWCGFQSTDKAAIDQLAKAFPTNEERHLFPDPWPINDDPYYSPDDQRAIFKSRGVVQESESDGWNYFGKYLLDAKTDEEIVRQAVHFIVRIVEYFDPELAKRRDIAELKNRKPTERRALISARRGQGRFRADLIEKWQGCAVSGTKIPEVLRASHIKPWSDSSDSERLDAENGLLLVANLDALFDRYLISFDACGAMLVSAELREKDRELLKLNGPHRLSKSPHERQKKYLEEHRKEAEKIWGVLLRCDSI